MYSFLFIIFCSLNCLIGSKYLGFFHIGVVIQYCKTDFFLLMFPGVVSKLYSVKFFQVVSTIIMLVMVLLDIYCLK